MKTVILGGGISGLLAAYVLRRQHPVLIEASPKLGGTYGDGGLKYIRRTALMANLLLELGVDYFNDVPRGVMLVNDERSGLDELPKQRVVRHPDFMLQLDPAKRRAYQMMHWVKSRGTAEGFTETCMNDPSGEAADVALVCDHTKLLSELARRAEMDGASLVTDLAAKQITPHHVVSDGIRVPYDRLITTLPLHVMSSLAPWAQLPMIRPRPLGIATFATVMRIPIWDYMYTPHDPKVSRVSCSNRTYQLEFPGGWDSGDTPNEAAFKAMDRLREHLPGVVSKLAVTRVIPGHLSPPKLNIGFPDNWFPLGRFAQWENRMTAEKVLDRVWTLT